MKQITLSDHVNDQVTAAAERRQTQYDQAQVSYQTAIERRQLRAANLKQGSQSAWTEGRYLAWLSSFVPRLFHTLSSAPSAPTKSAAQRDEIVFQAGANGEMKVAQALARQLSNEWVAISGYKNPGGEVDIVLVGPPGVMAIEVKFLNGKIFCDGDRWWRDKYDKYGNLVERAISITDRGGRSPSAQVNASADRLQRFLAERTPVQRVLRVVVLAHESSSLGPLSSLTVDAVSLINELNVPKLFTSIFPDREAYLVDDLVRLISDDHWYHEKRRASGPREGARTGHRSTAKK